MEEQHPLKDRVVRNMYALVEAYADIREKAEGKSYYVMPFIAFSFVGPYYLKFL